jgi:hypothetical protein
MHPDERGTQGNCPAFVRAGEQKLYCAAARAPGNCILRDSGILHPDWHVGSEGTPHCGQVPAEAREARKGGESQ